MRARLEGGFVVLEGREWSERFALRDLPGRLAFYQRLWSGAGLRDGAARLQHPGPQTRHYAQTLAELRIVQAEVGK
jgi:hypothetical protein